MLNADVVHEQRQRKAVERLRELVDGFDAEEGNTDALRREVSAVMKFVGSESPAKRDRVVNAIKAGAGRAALVVGMGTLFESARAGYQSMNFSGGTLEKGVQGLADLFVDKPAEATGLEPVGPMSHEGYVSMPEGDPEPEPIESKAPDSWWNQYSEEDPKVLGKTGEGTRAGAGTEAAADAVDTAKPAAETKELALEKKLEGKTLGGEAARGKNVLHLANELQRDPELKQLIIDREIAANPEYAKLKPDQVIHKWRVRLAKDAGWDFNTKTFTKTPLFEVNGKQIEFKAFVDKETGAINISADDEFIREHSAKSFPQPKPEVVPRPEPVYEDAPGDFRAPYEAPRPTGFETINLDIDGKAGDWQVPRAGIEDGTYISRQNEQGEPEFRKWDERTGQRMAESLGAESGPVTQGTLEWLQGQHNMTMREVELLERNGFIEKDGKTLIRAADGEVFEPQDGMTVEEAQIRAAEQRIELDEQKMEAIRGDKGGDAAEAPPAEVEAPALTSAQKIDLVQNDARLINFNQPYYATGDVTPADYNRFVGEYVQKNPSFDPTQIEDMRALSVTWRAEAMQIMNGADTAPPAPTPAPEAPPAAEAPPVVAPTRVEQGEVIGFPQQASADRPVALGTVNGDKRVISLWESNTAQAVPVEVPAGWNPTVAEAGKQLVIPVAGSPEVGTITWQQTDQGLKPFFDVDAGAEGTDRYPLEGLIRDNNIEPEKIPEAADQAAA